MGGEFDFSKSQIPTISPTTLRRGRWGITLIGALVVPSLHSGLCLGRSGLLNCLVPLVLVSNYYLNNNPGIINTGETTIELQLLVMLFLTSHRTLAPQLAHALIN